MSGGVVSFLFSRNPLTLGVGVLYGGALLALSTFSLKIWRQGKSCLPYILGQGGDFPFLIFLGYVWNLNFFVENAMERKSNKKGGNEK